MSSGSPSSLSPPPEDKRNHVNGAVARSRRQNVNYGIRNQYLASLTERELNGLNVYRCEDDDLSIRTAAAQARLPYDRMTLRELELFPEMARSQHSVALFLYIRNKTLAQWQFDPLLELTLGAILKELPEPFNSDVELVTSIHNYLERYGYINFGVFTRLSVREFDKKITIVVIGAGAAGLAAARQLKFFGFDVIVLEARPRLCGRVFTYHGGAGLPPIDLGGMIIKGIVGNPLITLIRQTQCNIVEMNQKCPIYDKDGKLIDLQKNEMILNSLNKILNTICYIVHEMGITKIEEDSPNSQNNNKNVAKKGGRKINLGEAIQLILNQNELRVKTRLMKYWQRFEQLCNKLKDAGEKTKAYRNAIDTCMDTLNQNGAFFETPDAYDLTFNGSVSHNQDLLNRKLSLRSMRQCLKIAVNGYEEAVQERREIEEMKNEYEKMEPSHVFMNDYDKRILDFHLANLESDIGAPLRTVALKDWDQDDLYGFDGSHITGKFLIQIYFKNLKNFPICHEFPET
uniref:SWIRM domain-containing protein n=1 Tax=Meloidogyne enterolobii TaxID=390850 RepID=A0A6V7VNN4_MELEN|nr:unnamed protein product [Meloidogyne enterolobii]